MTSLHGHKKNIYMKLEKFKLLLLIVGYNQVSNSKFITNLTSNKGNEYSMA